MSKSLTENNDKKNALSWLQSSDGEWCYFNQKNRDGENASDEDYIWFACHKSQSHKIGGYRILNQNIEKVIMSLAGVSDVAVFGIPNEKQGNSLHINIVLSQQGIDIDTLSSAVSAKVIGEFGEFANPNQINVLEKLPLVESKHICRKLLKSQKVAMSYAA